MSDEPEAWAYGWGRRIVKEVEAADALLDYPYTMHGTAYPTWRAQMVRVAETVAEAIRWFDDLVPEERGRTPSTP